MVTTSSNAMKALIDAAQATGFAVPRCGACGHRFYPPQSFCPHCLAPEIEYVPDSGDAIVLSTTRLHRTFDPAWTAALPVHIASVKTAAQLSLFVTVDRMLPVGTQVRIHLRHGLFHAEVRGL
ncbi:MULTISPECIES: Zn-ribbon domain-containing OB-fold protein [unclassified Variovorax]|uniref:Zn-ribbon domain-containing OB-fold protein n=1 Tax=unclassified Variovorax TaxID=663243 RepID=UPI003F47075B